MAYSSASSPANDTNLDVWESELLRWHETLDLLETALSHAGKLAYGLNLVQELESAFVTANRLAGQCALKVGRLRRSQDGS